MKLTVKNFGSVFSAEIDINHITLFIGDDSKSVVTKLIDAIVTAERTFYYDVLTNSGSLPNVNEEKLIKTLHSFIAKDKNLQRHINMNTYIHYVSDNMEFIYDAHYINQNYSNFKKYSENMQRYKILKIINEYKYFQTNYSDENRVHKKLNLHETYFYNGFNTHGYIVKQEDEPVFVKDGKEYEFNELPASMRYAISFILPLWQYGDSECLNIFEYPELCASPDTQKQTLNEVLTLTNDSKLLITTNSPYIYNHLTLLAQSGELYKKYGAIAASDIEKITPLSAIINDEYVTVYEFTNGISKHLKNVDGILSDDNSLNNYLGKTVEEFNDLLCIDEQYEYVTKQKEDILKTKYVTQLLFHSPVFPYLELHKAENYYLFINNDDNKYTNDLVTYVSEENLLKYLNKEVSLLDLFKTDIYKYKRIYDNNVLVKQDIKSVLYKEVKHLLPSEESFYNDEHIGNENETAVV